MLNKYIKCNFGGWRCSTSTIVDVRHLKVNIVYSVLQETFCSAFLLLSLYLQWYLLTDRVAVLRVKIIVYYELQGMWKLWTQIYFMLLSLHWYTVSLCTVAYSTHNYFEFPLINLHEGDIYKSTSGTLKAHMFTVLCYN